MHDDCEVCTGKPLSPCFSCGVVLDGTFMPVVVDTDSGSVTICALCAAAHFGLELSSLRPPA